MKPSTIKDILKKEISAKDLRFADIIHVQIINSCGEIEDIIKDSNFHLFKNPKFLKYSDKEYEYATHLYATNCNISNSIYVIQFTLRR